MPSFCAARGLGMSTGWPSMRISPVVLLVHAPPALSSAWTCRRRSRPSARAPRRPSTRTGSCPAHARPEKTCLGFGSRQAEPRTGLPRRDRRTTPGHCDRPVVKRSIAGKVHYRGVDVMLRVGSNEALPRSWTETQSIAADGGSNRSELRLWHQNQSRSRAPTNPIMIEAKSVSVVVLVGGCIVADFGTGAHAARKVVTWPFSTSRARMSICRRFCSGRTTPPTAP